MIKKKRLPHLVVAVAVGGLLAAISTPMAVAAPAGPVNSVGLSRAIDAAVGAVVSARPAQAGLRATARPRAGSYVMRTDRSGRWAFGSAVLPPGPDDETPQGWLYLARRSGNTWQVGLEYTSEFAALSGDAPAGVLTAAERKLLAPKGSGAMAVRAAGDTGLMLPYAVYQSWTFLSGAHGTLGDPVLNSIDLAGGDGRVLAADAGFGFAMCNQPGNPGWVRVYHDSLFVTDYYHLANNVNPGGAWVARGEFLGDISNDVSCGGYSNGPHVHFGLLYSSSPVPIHGQRIGGWTFETTGIRTGTVHRGTQVVDIGGGLRNYGVIEAAITSPRSDFNRDGRADIVTFTKGNTGDAWVELSNGGSFASPATKWHDQFGFHDELVLTGDFNNDRRDDLVAFTRGTSADIWVALSTGASFGNAVRWHSNFVAGDQVPGVGDFNGDGFDDIAMFTRGAAADVYVALSNGSSFGQARLWHSFFAVGDELPAIGDFNRDNRDDIATFTRGAAADVYVALSNGSSFGQTRLWHSFFAVGDELPAIGDFNRDNRDDIATFTRGPSADVYVALSNGSSFGGQAVKWHNSFASSTNIPGTGDFDNDGYDDIVSFTRGGEADVFVAKSVGNAFGTSRKWNDFFAVGDETPRPSLL